MILEKIAAATKIRVESEKEQVSLEKVKRKALELPKGDFAFEKQLKKEGGCAKFVLQQNRGVDRYSHAHRL